MKLLVESLKGVRLQGFAKVMSDDYFEHDAQANRNTEIGSRACSERIGQDLEMSWGTVRRLGTR